MYNPTTKYKNFLKECISDEYDFNDFKIEAFKDNYTLRGKIVNRKEKEDFVFSFVDNRFDLVKSFTIIGSDFEEKKYEILKKNVLDDRNGKTSIINLNIDKKGKPFTINLQLKKEELDFFDIKKDYFYSLIRKNLGFKLKEDSVNELFLHYGDIYIKLSTEDKKEFISLLSVNLGEVSKNSFDLLKLNYKK